MTEGFAGASASRMRGSGQPVGPASSGGVEYGHMLREKLEEPCDMLVALSRSCVDGVSIGTQRPRGIISGAR